MVGEFGGGADESADGVVGAQQRPQLLLGAVGSFRTQHDNVTFELGLERTKRNGDVILDWQSFNMSDGRAEFWSEHLRWDGHKVVVTNLVPVQLGWD